MLLDRRTKKRETVRTIAEYKLLKPPKDSKLKMSSGPIKVSLLDISVGGCALDSPHAVPTNAILSVRIDPLAFAIEASERRKDPLEMEGRVTSCITRSPEHYRLGICFTRIKKRDTDLIKRFIKIKERRKFPRFDMTRP